VRLARTTFSPRSRLDAWLRVNVPYEILHCPFADWRFRAPDAIAACGVHGLLVSGPKR